MVEGRVSDGEGAADVPAFLREARERERMVQASLDNMKLPDYLIPEGGCQLGGCRTVGATIGADVYDPVTGEIRTAEWW